MDYPMYPCYRILNGILQKNSALKNLNFINVKSISENALSSYYTDINNIVSVSFPDLTIIEDYGLTEAFSSCTGIINVSFPELLTVDEYGLENAFNGCTGITNISFPKLTTINTKGLQEAFKGCSGITGQVVFPELVTIGDRGLLDGFRECTNLTKISFPKLINIGDSGISPLTFYEDTNLTEIHFRASIKSTIEALDGYDNQFGASNATIYFDLGVAFVTINPNVSNCTIYFNNSIATNPLSMVSPQENKYYVYKEGYCLYAGSKTISSSDEGKNITENITMTSTGNIATLNISIPQNLENSSATVDLTVEYIVDGITFKADTLTGVSVGTTQTSTSLIVPANTEITYKISAEGYEPITNTITPSNNTINITLKQTNAKIIDLSYPFTSDTEYLANLVDNNNFVILDNTGTPASCIASGPKSYNAADGFSVGYIQFTTPDTDVSELLTLSVTCANSAESYSDYGVVFINTTGNIPTANVSFTTSAGSVDATYGEVLFQGNSDQSTTFRTVTKVLTKNTTYYLCFYYRKDGSVNRGWDRLAIQNIKIPVAI